MINDHFRTMAKQKTARAQRADTPLSRAALREKFAKYDSGFFHGDGAKPNPHLQAAPVAYALYSLQRVIIDPYRGLLLNRSVYQNRANNQNRRLRGHCEQVQFNREILSSLRKRMKGTSQHSTSESLPCNTIAVSHVTGTP